MSKIIKMSLKEMLSRIDLILRENDIIYFCNNETVIKEFIEKYVRRKNKMEDVKQFLIDHEEYIDKEKLILLIVKNYRDNLATIRERIEVLKKENNSFEKFTELQTLEMQYDIQTKSLEEALNIGRGVESLLSFYYYDDIQKRYRVEVADSKEIIDKKRVDRSKKLKRFDKIDFYFKSGNKDENLGMEYVIQSILLTDLYNVFPNEQFGSDIRRMILENEILKKGIKTKEELDALKTSGNQEEYSEVIDNISFDQVLLPDVKLTLREYVQYIDIDKLLLISAFRFNEYLEREGNKQDIGLLVGIKFILEGILDNIKSSNEKICCELQIRKEDTYELQEVSYSTKDIKKCISQFTNKRYLTTGEILEYKEKANNKEITLTQIEPDEIEIIFSREELEKISILSTDNFIYVSTKHEWNTEKIIDTIKSIGKCSNDLLKKLLDDKKIGSAQVIELYDQSLISIDDLRSIKEIVDLSKDISFEKLNSYYKESCKYPANEEFLNKYNKYLNLYREILLNDKSEKEVQEASNIAIEQIVEEFDGEDYNKAVKDYYKNRIITLDSIVDWNNENFITVLFDEGLISLEEMDELAKKKKISFDCLSGVYTNLIKNVDIEYDERLKLIKKGFVKEEDIIELYRENFIFENDLRKLAEEGFVTKEKMQKVIDSRTMEELEKHSAIKLTGLNSLEKRNNDIYFTDTVIDVDEDDDREDKSPKLIIDPNERSDFIHLLKAYRADTDLEEDSPFYNYEFYVIPDESGGIGLNSVIIAERYYEDKLTEERFSTNNATYFFKYKDLMVLSNLRKSEMTKQRKNIVFTANHALATEKKCGSWASSVIYGIARTMLSSDLKEYSKEQQRQIIIQKLSEIYSYEEIFAILDKAEKIDLGEYTCEIEEPVRKKKSQRSNDEIIK